MRIFPFFVPILTCSSRSTRFKLNFRPFIVMFDPENKEGSFKLDYPACGAMGVCRCIGGLANCDTPILPETIEGVTALILTWSRDDPDINFSSRNWSSSSLTEFVIRASDLATVPSFAGPMNIAVLRIEVRIVLRVVGCGFFLLLLDLTKRFLQN